MSTCSDKKTCYLCTPAWGIERGQVPGHHFTQHLVEWSPLDSLTEATVVPEQEAR